MNMRSGIAELRVNSAFYGGWKSIRVQRSIEQISGAFDLEITERWPGNPSATPLRPGHACQVLLDGTPVITGYVDTVETGYDANSHSIRVTGRDKTGDLVDCSAAHKGGQWRYTKLDRLARDLVTPYGINVLVETDTGTAFESHSVMPGESVFECLDRAARMKGVLLMSNTLGDLVISRTGSKRIPAVLEEGINIKAAQGAFSWKDRHSSYAVLGQMRPGLDDDLDFNNGAATAATVADKVINRHRPAVILSEEHGYTGLMQTRAEWERNVRRGRGNKGSITVQGWHHSAGELWLPNTRVHVHSPLLWLDTEMLIVSCTYTLDERGTCTELAIALPEAYEMMEQMGRSNLQSKVKAKQQEDGGGAWSRT